MSFVASMERGERKRLRGLYPSRFFRRLPFDVIAEILIRTQELSPVEIEWLSNRAMEQYKAANELNNGDSLEAEKQMNALIWPKILSERFKLDKDYYKLYLKKYMPNARHAFLAYAYVRRPFDLNSQTDAALSLNDKGIRFKVLVNPTNRTISASFYYSAENLSTASKVLISSLQEQIGAMQIDNNNTPIRVWWAWRTVYGATIGNTTTLPERLIYPVAMQVVYLMLESGFSFDPEEMNKKKMWHTQACIGCNAAEAVSVCSGCNEAAYCSRQCQATHWVRGGHREQCGGGGGQ